MKKRNDIRARAAANDAANALRMLHAAVIELDDPAVPLEYFEKFAGNVTRAVKRHVTAEIFRESGIEDEDGYPVP